MWEDYTDISYWKLDTLYCTGLTGSSSVALLVMEELDNVGVTQSALGHRPTGYPLAGDQTQWIQTCSFQGCPSVNKFTIAPIETFMLVPFHV